MKITYIKLTGYIGIYNGLGLNEIEIDLSKGPHKITVISGMNGCGKSTLLKAMTILPDSSSDFIPDVPAEKKMRIDDNGTIYDICITSAAGKNGSRGMSKASIRKNGIELNPNGNIGSYKEIIFDEFDLDSNFIALCRLSSDDRGLADKSPAERKKFMSFIVDSLDTYNAIYKNLNKKSSIFKSYINNLHNKIQTLGDEDSINATMRRLKNDSSYIESAITGLNAQIAAAGATMASLDPNGTLQEEYTKAQSDFETFKERRDSTKRVLDMRMNWFEGKVSVENLSPYLDKVNDEIRTTERKADSLEADKNNLISRLETLNRDIADTKYRVDNLSKEVDQGLRDTLDKTRKRIDTEISYLKEAGIDNPDEVSKDELELVSDTIHGIINMIDHLYDDMTDEKMAKVLEYTDASIELLDSKIQTQTKMLDKAKDDLNTLERDQEKLTDLDKRPDDCTIDYCPYIKAACELKSSKYASKNIMAILVEAYDNYSHLEDEVTDLMAESVQLREVAKSVDYLDRIKDRLNSNKAILCKTSIGKQFVDNFQYNIEHLSSFNEYRDLYDLNDSISVLTYYRNDTKTLRNLEAELSKQSNSEALLDELVPRLETMKHDAEELDNQMIAAKKKSDDTNERLSILYEARSKMVDAIDAKETYDKAEADTENAEGRINNILSKSKDCVDLIAKQEQWNSQIIDFNAQLTPIKDQISKIEGQLAMLDSYKTEYNEYSQKYNLVEVLKKYSSPRTGIQTVFMDMYMSKTLELANNVLGMIFGGQYRLLDYVINENEFRMPFVGSGMVVDDISSGSTSQVCMMGMVMNLVLKYQASPRYNIASLDEIDGGLDTRNRLEFISVLYKLIDILNIDQLFIISHSLEIELSNVNIIKLRSYDDFGDSASSDEGYILYDFNNVKH